MSLGEKLSGLILFAAFWYFWNVWAALAVAVAYLAVGIPVGRWFGEFHARYGIGSPWLAEQEAKKAKKPETPRVIVSP